MEKKRLQAAENALKQIAAREGKSVPEIKKEIEKAMLIGLCSQDPKVQAYWRRIPRQGELPTPEELILFLADETQKRRGR